MAITKSLLRFLLTQRDDYRLGTSGGRLLTLGVQDVHATHDEIAEILRAASIDATAPAEGDRRYTVSQVVPAEKRFAHVADLFTMMGFDEVETLDFSNAEGPDHVWNLNDPVPDALRGRFDVVLDVGVLEHICNVRQSVENVMAMTKVGGRVILILPLFGWHNMVYFNFQPPFFPEAFLANGFDRVRSFANYYPIWREWDDRPLIYQEYLYGDEIEFTKRFYRTNLCFFARKEREVDPFVTPNQGWYVEYHKAEMNDAPAEAAVPPEPRRNPIVGALKAMLRARLPYGVKARIWDYLDRRRRAKLTRETHRRRRYRV